jgi:hypothetical protein
MVTMLGEHCCRTVVAKMIQNNKVFLLPFDEPLNELFCALFVDMALVTLFVKDIVECEGLIRADDADLWLVGDVGYAL